MEAPLDRLVNKDELGISSIDEILGPDPEEPSPIFKPSGAEDFPAVRNLFSTADDEVEAAYQALRDSSR
jgi:hypothetical protein